MKICRNKIGTMHIVLASTVVLLIALMSSYMYLLSAAVVHVVIQKEGARSINELQSEIGDLEAEYIARQHEVSSKIAVMDGFVEASDKIFIHKGDSSLVLLTDDR